MDYNIALLIDSENASPSDIGNVIDELNVQGNILYKRIYGDFTSQQSAGWKGAINQFSLSPIQQFTYIAKKNVTDSRMIIDAMDILYSGNVNCFCIMSSDSDFTGIVKRLKESGVTVFGAGKSTTPQSFVSSCDRFFTVKSGQKKKPAAKATAQAPKATAPVPAAPQPDKKPDQPEAVSNVEEIIEHSKKILNSYGETIVFAKFMKALYRGFPNFDPKDYGVTKPGDFFKRYPDFVLQMDVGKNALMISLSDSSK